jgi:hypothetical protein
MIRQLLLALLLALAGTTLPTRAAAHALEPGFLELLHIGGSEWRVTWRVPQVVDRPMAIDAVLPDSCEPRRGPAPDFDGRAFVSGWIANCKTGLAGGEIRIEGLETTRTDVLVRYTLEGEAAPQVMRLTASTPAFVVPAAMTSVDVFASYFRLGVDHILQGVDHLLFVFLLVLLIRDWRRLLGAITAFTVAHSLSLAAATLGWIVIPTAPVEAVVALSIAVLAAELIRPPGSKPSLTERAPSVVAFAFGLLHGLGFASALLDIGLPEGDVPLALLAFNLGVEAGQILFIAVVLALGAAFARLCPKCRGHFLLGSPALRTFAYGIGALAAFWVFERMAVFVA